MGRARTFMLAKAAVARMAMNWFLAASGVLVLVLGAFHSVAGERYLVRRLLRRDNLPILFGDDSFTKLTIRYAWHLLTIFCLIVAGILFLHAANPEPARASIAVIAGGLGLSGVWGLVSTRARHLSWVVLLAAAALVGAALVAS